MSLDVYLTVENETVVQPEVVYLRENGGISQLTVEEWCERFPDRDPVVVSETETGEVYSANITHNLGKMAAEAGLYKFLWRPEEVDTEKAGQLIEPLQKGLAKLETDPERFQKFNPPNGWGDYDGLVRFVRNYLDACERYPEATVRVWR